MRANLVTIGWIVFAMVFIDAHSALATQGHGGIEGVYVHQLAHIFFILSMGILIYWLREHGLVAEKSWRYIQYAAWFFILWNLDTLLVHALDDQFPIIHVETIDAGQMRISSSPPAAAIIIFYYLAKLDHLLSVPALVCLYLGLRRLAVDQTDGIEDIP